MGKSLAARSALLLTAGITAFGAGVLPAFAQSDRPGNNGTVKVDNIPVEDDDPNNEPHVGCPFEVDFYGYGQGDFNATVTFEAHPPTTRAGNNQLLLTDTVFIGEDSPGGGTDLDASEAYTLDFTGIEAHDQQGYHVKLTVNAPDSKGADVKHKVFWVKCPTPTPTKTTETPTEKPTKTETPTKTKTPHVSPTKTKPATAKPTHKESPAVVPTSVPAGGSGPGAGVTLTYVGLAGASAAAAVGGALYRRRHNS